MGPGICPPVVEVENGILNITGHKYHCLKNSMNLQISY
jgi:hypothetical protein